MIEIRPDAPRDGDAIRNVHLNAFETSLEADLVQRLKQDGDAIISLVAVEDGAIAGHILFSRMRVTAEGRKLKALGLAPVSVLPDRQGQGIGSRLIEAGIAAAVENGAEMIFVLGEPDYYGRFGFQAETAAPFASPYAGRYFQAKALRNDFSLPRSGRADYAPAFAELA